MDTQTKLCPRCKENKELHEFKINSKTKKHSGQCKKCRKERRDELFVKNGGKLRKPIIIEGNQRSCPHCDQMKVFSDFQHKKGKPQGWCQECRKQCNLEYRRKQGQKEKKFSKIENGQKLCMYCDKMINISEFSPSKRGFGGVSAYCKRCTIEKFYKPNKEKYKERTYKYRIEQREKYLAQHRVHQFNRKNIIKATDDGTVTEEFAKEIYATEICYFCKQQIVREERTMEHLIPLSRGGPHSASNIVMSCKSCNSSKTSKTEEEYYEYIGK